jgi:NAD(P)-dependent dehydrogenase (short-subunit alcohol dehydrogenase family)
MAGTRPIGTALVTGGTRRLGRSIALALAQEGANVVVHYRGSAADAEALCARIGSLGVRAWPLHADFADPSETGTLVERAVGLAGRLDVLINNASVFGPSTLADLSFEGLADSLRVNAWAPFALARDFARRAEKGAIVNLLDARLSGYDLSHAAYILAKHTLAQLTRMAALAWAPKVRVNGVAPGPMLPPPGGDAGYLDALAATLPLGRHGDPRDIAEAVLFLIRSEFITGEIIYVDGGQHLEPDHGPHPHH